MGCKLCDSIIDLNTDFCLLSSMLDLCNDACIKSSYNLLAQIAILTLPIYKTHGLGIVIIFFNFLSNLSYSIAGIGILFKRLISISSSIYTTYWSSKWVLSFAKNSSFICLYVCSSALLFLFREMIGPYITNKLQKYSFKRLFKDPKKSSKTKFFK